MEPPKAESLRGALGNLLGPSYKQTGLGIPKTISTTDFNGWCIEDLTFAAADGEEVPAFFLRPPDGTPPVPAVIYAHAHGNRYDFGRAELLEGRPTLQGDYATDLQRAGIAALCIEMPCFGRRQLPSESARAKAKLWHGDTLFGQMLSEQRAGIDFLESHIAIDQTRIGAMGFSMGSTIAFWLSALDVRVKATVAMCSFADLKTLMMSDSHDGHGIYMTVPGLLHCASTGEIAGLTAPRALQICAGLKDWSTPKDALEAGLGDLEAAYLTSSLPAALDIFIEAETGHIETPEMRARVLKFFHKQL